VLPHFRAETPSPGDGPSGFAGPTIKAALFLGLALTLGLWLFAGYRMASRIGDLESAAAGISARYVRAQDMLSDAQSQVLVGSILVRDALLDRNPANRADNRRTVDETYAAAERALAQYVPVGETADERQGVHRLRQEIEQSRARMLEALDASTDSAGRASSRVLQRRIIPQRDTILRITDQVQALVRNAFTEQLVQTAEVYRAAERRALWRLGAALAANLAIGIIAALYAGRLETRLRRQRTRDLHMTQELQRLSARLVTAQEEERRMIARELHDEVGQSLAAIRVELSLAQRAPTDPEATAARMDALRSITEGTLRTIRDLSHLLHPAMLDDLGLIAALESLTAGFADRHACACVFVHDNLEERLPPPLEAAVFRIVQEALSNVARHAHATTCQVSVRRTVGHVHVAIQDDGIGFDLPDDGGGYSGGLGLVGVRERAALFAGTLTVATAPNRGTRLDIQLAIPQEKDAPTLAHLSR
jgi:signal transduction histidine kinase